MRERKMWKKSRSFALKSKIVYLLVQQIMAFIRLKEEGGGDVDVGETKNSQTRSLSLVFIFLTSVKQAYATTVKRTIWWRRLRYKLSDLLCSCCESKTLGSGL